MYASLATLYKFTPAECADMTPYQQLMLIDPDRARETVSFNTQEEWAQWMASRSH